MTTEKIQEGEILLFAFPQNKPQGHEQEGIRPGIVVVPPQENTRYPIVVAIPLTTQDGEWTKNHKLYVKISAGEGNLPNDSIALIDQERAIDVNRIKSYIGKLNENIYNNIKKLLLDFVSGND